MGLEWWIDMCKEEANERKKEGRDWRSGEKLPEGRKKNDNAVQRPKRTEHGY